MFIFRICASIVIFVGAIMSMGVVWDLADVLMGVMAIINLPVIVMLHSVTLHALDDYLKQKKEGKNPVYKASVSGLEGKTDYWQ
jgi:AGCS family alanine or glycine:cation symporter